MPQGKQSYTIAEAAKLLRYSERSVRQMCRDGRFPGAYKIPQGRKWIIPKDAIQKEKIEEVRREKAKSSSEQVPPQVASGEPGRRQPVVDATVLDGLRGEHGRRKRRHLVKAVDPRMTWCGHSLDGRIHLFWTNKIELCTCWHCLTWYNYAVTGVWPTG